MIWHRMRGHKARTYTRVIEDVLFGVCVMKTEHHGWQCSCGKVWLT